MDGFGKKSAVKETLLLRILWCSQSGEHPGNKILANFGYILDMKVGKKRKKEILVYSWVYITVNYHKKSVYLKK